MYALSINTGELKWKSTTNSYVRSSPGLTHRVFIGSGFEDDSLHCLDLSNGKEVWTFKSGAGILSSPIITKNGDTVIVGSNDNYLYAVDSATGSIRWKFRTAADVRSSPSFSSDGTVVYVGSNDGFVYGISVLSGTRTFAFQTGSASIPGSVASSNDGACLTFGAGYRLFHICSSQLTRNNAHTVPDQVKVGL